MTRVKTLCGYDGVYDNENMFYVKLRQQEDTRHSADNESWFIFFDYVGAENKAIVACINIGYYEDLWSKSGPDYKVLDIGSYKLSADTIRDYPDLAQIWRSR